MCRQECAASCPHRTREDQCTPPFFRAFHALAVDDGGSRTHGTESRLTNHGDSRGNRFLNLRFRPGGLACRVFLNSNLAVRGLEQWSNAQDPTPEGLGVNLTSVPCSRTGFPLRLLATLLIKRVVDPFQGAVIGPQIEVVVDRAFLAAGLSGSPATDSRSTECT